MVLDWVSVIIFLALVLAGNLRDVWITFRPEIRLGLLTLRVPPQIY